MREILSAIRRSHAEATLGGIVAIAFMVAAAALVLLTGEAAAAGLGALGFVPFMVGATNEINAEGDHVNVVLTNPASGGTSGGPARFGQIGGVMVMDQASDGTSTLALRGVHNLSVKGIDDTGNVAVAKGDRIYYVDADTPKLSRKASGFFFGYALATVSSGATTTIQVLLARGGDSASQAEAGAIDPTKIGLLVSADTGDLAALDLVYIKSYDAAAGRYIAGKADANVAGANAAYIAPTAITAATVERVYKAFLSGATLNTSGATVGDPVYLSETAGGWTLTAPTASGSRVQIVGRVVVVSATVGQILFDLLDLPTTKIGGNELMAAIDIATTGSVKVTGGTAGAGYGTGAGGAVTQITSITTGVTLNKLCGQITTVAATTAAGAEDTFTVTDSAVAATDVVVVATTYAGGGTPIVYCKKVAAGSFDITISNLHATAALDALLVINYAVIKAVAA